MTVVAALLVVAVLTYRFSHSHTPSSQLPRWVGGVPPVASALSFIALGVQFIASRVSRAQRKRLEAVYTAAGATAAGSDLPTWLSWLRPGCAPVASASAQIFAVVVLVASVGTTVAGSSLTARLASAAPHPTVTATLMPTMTATPSGPHDQRTYSITDSAADQANVITATPDGSLWWTGQGAFGHLSPGGAMTTVPYPSSWTGNQSGNSLIPGPDGNLWFTIVVTNPTTNGGNYVGKLSPTGAITEYPLSRLNRAPAPIVLGPDGNLWFTEYGFAFTRVSPQQKQDGVIGRVTPAGAVTEFPIPTGNVHPLGLTVGPDGNLWFTAITSADPTTASNPPTTADIVGRITTSGAVTIFHVPGQTETMSDIVVGPDHNLWFGLGSYSAFSSANQASQLGRITTSGQFLSSVTVPSSLSGGTNGGLPGNLVVGADGNMYYGDFAFQSNNLLYGPLLETVISASGAGETQRIGTVQCYAVSTGPGGSIACAEASDIYTFVP